MRIRILPEAAAEIDETEAFLARQSPELADDFRAAVGEAFQDIVKAPSMYPRANRGRFRREERIHIIRRFSYSVIYVVGAGEIIVVALPHHGRRPGYWSRRPI